MLQVYTMSFKDVNFFFNQKKSECPNVRVSKHSSFQMSDVLTSEFQCPSGWQQKVSAFGDSSLAKPSWNLFKWFKIKTNSTLFGRLNTFGSVKHDRAGETHLNEILNLHRNHFGPLLDPIFGKHQIWCNFIFKIKPGT